MSQTPAEPAAHDWILQGRVTPQTSPHSDAPPFEGGRGLIEQCGTIRPCAAERWTQAADSATTVTLLRRGDQFYQEDGTTWNARWWTISGILRACLGDPLSVPPTTDPGAYRTLHTPADGGYWTIHLSGQNPCGLTGEVRLMLKEDKIDLSDLKCGDKPWKKGGRKCAMSRRDAALKTTSGDDKLGG